MCLRIGGSRASHFPSASPPSALSLTCAFKCQEHALDHLVVAEQTKQNSHGFAEVERKQERTLLFDRRLQPQRVSASLWAARLVHESAAQTGLYHGHRHSQILIPGLFRLLQARHL